MPKRRSSGSGATIGFFGTGEMDPDHAIDLIEDWINAQVTANDPVRFWFPVTSIEFSPTLQELVESTVDTHIPYEAVTSPQDKNRRDYAETLSRAAKVHSVEDPIDLMERELSAAPGPALFVLWDKARDNEMQEVANSFIAAGVSVYEISDVLVPISAHEEAEVAAAALDSLDEQSEGYQGAYTLENLEKLGRGELRDICETLGIQPRRASAAMIEDILASQGGGPGEEAPVEPEPEEPVAAEVEVMPVVPRDHAGEKWVEVTPRIDIDRLEGVFTAFLGRLEGILKEYTQPVAPQPQTASQVPEEAQERPTRRRMVRRS